MLATVTKFMVVCGVAVGSRYSVSSLTFDWWFVVVFLFLVIVDFWICSKSCLFVHLARVGGGGGGVFVLCMWVYST